MNPAITSITPLPNHHREELQSLAAYLKGFADAKENQQLRSSSEWLQKLSTQVCSQGYIGCYNVFGKCTSDHK